MYTIPMKTKRAVIYCRVSTKEQVVEGNSLSSQERICREYADRNNFEIAEVFLEKGESAKTDDRTELLRLLSYCEHKRNRIDVVVFYKIDRWARYHLDYGNLKVRLKKNGIIVQSATEHLEDTPAGRFMENVLASQAQFDNEMRAERCAGGMKDAMREGRYVWMAPVGYENVKVGGKATIAIHPESGPLIRQAFEMIATNSYPIEEVRKTITKAGLRTPKGKPLCKAYFYRLFTNEVYAGWIHKFGERHKGTFEPLVSDELFEQVQRVLKHKGKAHKIHITDNPDFPLRRFVVNANGYKLTGSWSKGKTKKYPYYRFGGKGSNYRKEAFEQAFMHYMDRFALSEKYYSKLLKSVRKYFKQADKDALKNREQLFKQATELQEKQNLLIQKNLDGVISDTILSQQLTYLEEEMIKVQSQLSVKKEDVSFEEALLFLEEYFKKPSKIWLYSKLPRKIALQEFQFPSGLVFDGKSFGTQKIRMFFKVKRGILDENSTEVDSGFDSWNLPEKSSTEIDHADDNNETIVNVHTSKELFWLYFRKDVFDVYRILNNKEYD